MKLLLDANVSWRLCTLIKEHFPDCVHVDKTALLIPASDQQIWNYALTQDAVVVTNDEDFLNLLNVYGFPPKVILLRTGNQSTTFIADLLINQKSAINEFFKSDEIGLLEIL